MRTLIPLYRNKELEHKAVIYQFQGDDRWLSNFWSCNIILPAEGDLPAMQFDALEKAYMAWKTLDLKARLEIQKMKPGTAKRFSYSNDFEYRQPYNNEMRIEIMHILIMQKFSLQNPELLRMLLETDNALIIEGNVHCDTFFGFDLDNGYGQNTLGRIIMDVRQLRQQSMLAN